MTKANTEKRKEQIRNLFRTFGVYNTVSTELLIKRLEAINFFVAPASTKYHGAYVGGLFDHSLEVANALTRLTTKLNLKWTRPESPLIIGLCHDLCKCDQYIINLGMNNDITINYNDNLALTGHGDKSVVITQKIIPLTDEEIMCIHWHMGAFDDKENWQHYNAAIKEFPNVLFAHTADMIASQIMGV